MKPILLLILFCSSVLCIEGQNTDGITIKKNAKGIVEYVKFPLRHNELKQVIIPENANDFFIEYLRPSHSITFIYSRKNNETKISVTNITTSIITG